MCVMMKVGKDIQVSLEGHAYAYRAPSFSTKCPELHAGGGNKEFTISVVQIITSGVLALCVRKEPQPLKNI